MKSAVVFVVFNRPDTTQEVFNAIRKRKVPKLYVSSDAPRLGNESDVKNCVKVKKIVESIDWECEVKYRYLEKNVGCGVGVSSAVTWALESEDRIIVLEDDCVPAQPFFDYCDHLLEKFKDDERIWMITGRQYFPEFDFFKNYDYLFSRFGWMWGWATWKRSWDHFDIHASDLEQFLSEDGFSKVLVDKKQSKFYQKSYTDLLNDESYHTHAWIKQYIYTILKNSGLSIVPSKNLIHNIGDIGVHSIGLNYHHLIQKHEDYELKAEPKYVICDNKYSELYFKKLTNPRRPFVKRVFRKLKRMFFPKNK